MTKHKRKQTSPKGNQNKIQVVDNMTENTNINKSLETTGNTSQPQNLLPMGFQPFSPMSPPFNYYMHGQEEPAWAKKLIDKIEQVGKDFSKLEERFNKKLEGIEKSITFMSSEFDDFKTNISKLQNEMESLKNENRQLKEEIYNNTDAILDSKCRSMRDNLLIHGIDENKNEECEETVRNFLETKLGIDTKCVEIERSHRIGKYQKEKKRPIVTKFLRFKDKENIKRCSYKLKGTAFGVSDQFPKEINEKRSILRKVEKDEKANGRPAFLSVDRLYTPGWCFFVKDGKVNKVPSKRPVHPQRHVNNEGFKGPTQNHQENSISQVIEGAHSVLHANH